MKQKKNKSTEKKKPEKKSETIPYHRKPADLSLEAWQVALRKQFVTDKSFGIKKFL